MSTLGIILLVLFTLVMALWVLALLGAAPITHEKHGWLAWVAVLILGIIVFLVGSGVISHRQVFP